MLTESKPNFMSNQVIGMRLENDQISFSGNQYLLGQKIKVCPIGSIEFATKDEIYFDSSGCSMTTSGWERQYGTYNLITKELHLTNGIVTGLVQGAFTCHKS